MFVKAALLLEARDHARAERSVKNRAKVLKLLVLKFVPREIYLVPSPKRVCAVGSLHVSYEQRLFLPRGFRSHLFSAFRTAIIDRRWRSLKSVVLSEITWKLMVRSPSA